MRLIVLTVMGLIAGLGLAAAIVALPVMANKGPQRATLVADLGGAQEQKVQGEGNPDGRGRAVVKVFEEQLCAKVKTGTIESSSSKVTIHLGMSGEKGPTVANLQEQASTTSLPESTTPTTGTTGTTTGATTGTTGTTSTTTGTTSTTTGTTTPTTGTTTATAGTTGSQTGTTTGDTTLAQTTTTPQATTTPQSTTVEQTSLSQSTASPTASPSASASAIAAAATSFEHTGGCVAVPRALSLELLEHPRRFYVEVTNGHSPEGAIRGQLHSSSGHGDHRSGHGGHRRGDADDD